eukprot:14845261-Alexandrium_andersonii.AAC.1
MLPVESTRRRESAALVSPSSRSGAPPALPSVVFARCAVNNGMLTTMHACINGFMSIKSSGGPIAHTSYDTSQGGTGISGTYPTRSACLLYTSDAADDM